MALFRRRPAPAPVDAPQLVLPRASIDGWTLAGTAIGARLSPADRRELETLLHAVAVHSDSPWTYERAAALLEKAGEPGQALAVLDLWPTRPAATWPSHAHATRGIDKRRARLRLRSGAEGGGTAAVAG
jgi:hypothetical protein